MASWLAPSQGGEAGEAGGGAGRLSELCLNTIVGGLQTIGLQSAPASLAPPAPEVG